MRQQFTWNREQLSRPSCCISLYIPPSVLLEENLFHTNVQHQQAAAQSQPQSQSWHKLHQRVSGTCAKGQAPTHNNNIEYSTHKHRCTYTVYIIHIDYSLDKAMSIQLSTWVSLTLVRLATVLSVLSRAFYWTTTTTTEMDKRWLLLCTSHKLLTIQVQSYRQWNIRIQSKPTISENIY